MLEFYGAILEFVGTVLIAYAALSVHHRFLREHKVDERVLAVMKFEQWLGILGIVFLVAGFYLQWLV